MTRSPSNREQRRSFSPAGLPFAAAVLSAVIAGASPAHAQMPNAGPPPVAVLEAAMRPVTQSQEFIGRIQAEGRVNLVARVTAQLEKVAFVEGTEVKKGDVLYLLERAPFEAVVANNQASVQQFAALFRNAVLTTQRAQTLLRSPAGQQSSYDSALATQQSYAAQIEGAKAQLKTAQINLGYTTITAPIDGKIGRTAVTEGNIVGQTSGTLAMIVSQDPMYVTFPVPSRDFVELARVYGEKGGFKALTIKLRLPDGTMYSEQGKLDFVDPTIAQGTDTVSLRGTIPNPLIEGTAPGDINRRQLIDGAFVTVLLQGVQPVERLAIPRLAVLADQQGSYVFVVGNGDVVEQRRVQLAESTPAIAMIASGLKVGERVIVDGLQRVRPGIKVAPSPAPPIPGVTAPGP